MAGERWGRVRYGGVFLSVQEGSYTVGWGVSPGVVQLRCNPGAATPPPFGDFVILDGQTSVAVPGCKLADFKTEKSGSEFTWSLCLYDRRWRWQGLGRVSVWANQLDAHGKLIPWTIRSPAELARLCLDALGETGYTVDLPPGLDSATGARFFASNPPWQGVTQQTGTNPPTEWQDVPPAQALADLCEQYGRVPAYDLSTDSVRIVQRGVGLTSLPPGSVRQRSPSLKAPQQPDGIVVVGDPTRYQVRLDLEAVGEEWDGTLRPINDLSYAPVLTAAVQITTVTPTAPVAAAVYRVTVEGVVHEYLAATTSVSAVTSGLAAAINASVAKVRSACKATSDATTLTLTGVVPGAAFDVSVDITFTPGSSRITNHLTQAAREGGPSWEMSGPPLFPTVRATDRLSYFEARAKAQRSVFRLYRVSGVDVSGKGFVNVPGYGLILRRQQLIISDVQVDQATPQKGDDKLINRATNEPLVQNFYNGYSRDKPAEIYGEAFSYYSQAWYPGQPMNTLPGKLFLADFTVDPAEQTVAFGVPVYLWDHGLTRPASIALQCAVQVRDPASNQPVRFEQGRSFNTGGDNHYAVLQRPDVQLNVTSVYDEGNNLKSSGPLEQDPYYRAKYYLDAATLEYQLKGGETVDYNGLVFIPLDGQVAQVTWSVGAAGPRTTASRNVEHNVYVPPYPARRRAERLPPAEKRRFNPYLDRLNLGE